MQDNKLRNNSDETCELKHEKPKDFNSDPCIWTLRQARHDRVQYLAGVHGRVRLGLVHVVIAAELHGLALAIDEFLQDLALILLQLCRGRGEGLLQVSVSALLCQLLRPIASHP